MGSRLLMAHQDVPDPSLALGDVQSVVNGEDGSARIAEDRVDPVPAQGIHQRFRPGGPTGQSVGCGSVNSRGGGREGHGVTGAVDPPD